MKTYPIVEIFDSLQGEGLYTNHQMTFVRLAGCNVGIYPSQVQTRKLLDISVEELNSVPQGHSICQTATGVCFTCDTDYHMSSKMEVLQITEQCFKAKRVCLTGGEPFLHDLVPLVQALDGKFIHVETSGTKIIPEDFLQAVRETRGCHIACSPKAGYQSVNSAVIDEFKFVVKPNGVGSKQETVTRIARFCTENDVPAWKVFIQPYNEEDKVNVDSLRFAQEVVSWNPHWKLSVQLHKLLNIR